MIGSTADLHVARLRGTFLIYIARGDASVPLAILVKTVQTDLRKEHVSPADVRAILEEARTAGVEGFRERASYDERRRRFEALADALSVVLAQTPA